MHAMIKGFLVATLLAAFVGHHHGWFVQDDKKQDAKKEAAGGGMPEPTAEHKWLAEGAGKWKAVGKMYAKEGPMPMSGVQTNTMQQGGLWQIIDYKDDSGMFVGHGVSGYDPAKKKFVSVWVDNTGMALEPAEGTLSADKKTLTMTFGMTNPETGKRMAIVETITRKDDKTTLFEMNEVSPDEKTTKMLEITYTKM
jgi:Protein of unknown function (DUF1579)